MNLIFLKLIRNFKNSKIIFLLPKILNSNLMKFVEWKEKDTLTVNKFGIPEPFETKKKIIYLILFLFHW